MAAAPAKAAGEAPAQAMRLSDLVGALSREFVAASASHHATLNHWKQRYQDSPVLAEHQPEGMKIVSARLSVPVALSQVKMKQRVARVSKSMIAGALARDLPRARRLELADGIYAELARSKALSFANAQLAADLDKAARKLLPEAAQPLDRQAIADLQREYLAQPDREGELDVLYRADDLKRLDPGLTFRLDLELKLA